MTIKRSIRFGDKLRAMRKRAGLSQMALARAIDGMSQTRISVLENQGKAPSEEVLEKFASYFRVPITYFFGHEDTRNVEQALRYIERLKARSFASVQYEQTDDLLDT